MSRAAGSCSNVGASADPVWSCSSTGASDPPFAIVLQVLQHRTTLKAACFNVEASAAWSDPVWSCCISIQHRDRAATLQQSAPPLDASALKHRQPAS